MQRNAARQGGSRSRGQAAASEPRDAARPVPERALRHCIVGRLRAGDAVGSSRDHVPRPPSRPSGVCSGRNTRRHVGTAPEQPRGLARPFFRGRSREGAKPPAAEEAEVGRPPGSTGGSVPGASPTAQRGISTGAWSSGAQTAQGAAPACGAERGSGWPRLGCNRASVWGPRAAGLDAPSLVAMSVCSPSRGRPQLSEKQPCPIPRGRRTCAARAGPGWAGRTRCRQRAAHHPRPEVLSGEQIAVKFGQVLSASRFRRKRPGVPFPLRGRRPVTTGSREPLRNASGAEGAAPAQCGGAARPRCRTIWAPTRGSPRRKRRRISPSAVRAPPPLPGISAPEGRGGTGQGGGGDGTGLEGRAGQGGSGRCGADPRVPPQRWMKATSLC